MKTRAKFRVESVLVQAHAETVKMTAVYGGSTNAEDNSFSAATPSADLSMSITNKSLHGQFKPGQKFYADFSLCEDQS